MLNAVSSGCGFGVENASLGLYGKADSLREWKQTIARAKSRFLCLTPASKLAGTPTALRNDNNGSLWNSFDFHWTVTARDSTVRARGSKLGFRKSENRRFECPRQSNPSLTDTAPLRPIL